MMNYLLSVVLIWGSLTLLPLSIHASDIKNKILSEDLQQDKKNNSKVLDEIAAEEFRKNSTINLLWINELLDKNQEFIFPSTITRREKEFCPFDRINDWSQFFPVVVWYDSQFTTPKAIENTLKKINQNNHKSEISLKDIRLLSTVKDNSEVFNEKNMLYFRVDLLRAITGYETLIQTYPSILFIYADLSIKAFDPFNEVQTVQNLKDFGIVMASPPLHFEKRSYENSFQILSKNENLLISLKYGIIDINIQRSKVANNPQIGEWGLKISNLEPSDLEQIVYTSYLNMFKIFYALEKKGKLTRSPSTVKINQEGKFSIELTLDSIKNDFHHWLEISFSKTKGNEFNNGFYTNFSPESSIKLKEDSEDFLIPTIQRVLPESHF